jgi:hypothetical protein
MRVGNSWPEGWIGTGLGLAGLFQSEEKGKSRVEGNGVRELSKEENTSSSEVRLEEPIFMAELKVRPSEGPLLRWSLTHGADLVAMWRRGLALMRFATGDKSVAATGSAVEL